LKPFLPGSLLINLYILLYMQYKTTLAWWSQTCCLCLCLW